MTSLLDAVYIQCERALSVIVQPAHFFQDPSKRIFWPYLLMSLLITALIFVCRYRRRWLMHLYERLLSHRLWLHPSALLDYQLMVVKALFRVFLFGSWIISSYAIAVGLVTFANDQFGPTNLVIFSDATVTIIYTLALFLCSDFSRYLVHRLCHEIPILWQFHQVHHSAEVMTPLTLYRSHPVENLIFVFRGVVVTGVVTGIFFYLFGTRAIQAQILGVNALGLLFHLLGANLRHSHVWISYGPIVERVLLSPAQHQLHHSDHPRHHGANYGSCLAIWDRFAGSLRIAFGEGPLHFGLSDENLNHDPHGLGSALVGPFRGCWQILSKPFRGRQSMSRVESD